MHNSAKLFIFPRTYSCKLEIEEKNTTAAGIIFNRLQNVSDAFELNEGGGLVIISGINKKQRIRAEDCKKWEQIFVRVISFYY